MQVSEEFRFWYINQTVTLDKEISDDYLVISSWHFSIFGRALAKG